MNLNKDFTDTKASMSIKREMAQSYFEGGLNCAQSLILAFSPDYSLDEKTAKSISLGFGAGMGRLREVCGALSAAFMVMGLHYGEKVTKAQMYDLQQKFAAMWKEDNGSIICRELLGATEKLSSSDPSVRTGEYQKKRPCAELVGYTAQRLEDFLAKN